MLQSNIPPIIFKRKYRAQYTFFYTISVRYTIVASVYSVGLYRTDTQKNCRTAHSWAEVKESPLYHLQVVKLVNAQA